MKTLENFDRYQELQLCNNEQSGAFSHVPLHKTAPFFDFEDHSIQQYFKD